MNEKNVLMADSAYLEHIASVYSVLTSQIEDFLRNTINKAEVDGYESTYFKHDIGKDENGEKVHIFTPIVFFSVKSQDIKDSGGWNRAIASQVPDNLFQSSKKIVDTLAAFTINNKLEIVRDPDGRTYNIPLHMFKILGAMCGADFKTTEVIMLGSESIGEDLYKIGFMKQLKSYANKKKINPYALKAKRMFKR